MSKRRRRTKYKNRIIEIRKKIAQKTIQGIIILASALLIPCLALMLRIGEEIYPAWVVLYRLQIIGILLLGFIVVVVSSPLVVEANSNPRTLSGPGKNPYTEI